MPHPFLAHSWFWWGKGCWILTAKGVETAHGDCLSRAVSLSFISGLIFKRSAGAAERPQCTECCPCRAWHPPCWSSFPPFVLRKLPCRQRGTGDTRPSAALQGKPAGSFPAWRVTLLVAGLRVSEDVPPRPALSPRPPQRGWSCWAALPGLSEQLGGRQRGADSSARSPAAAPLPCQSVQGAARAAQSSHSSQPHCSREPGGIGTRGPSSRAPPALPPLRLPSSFDSPAALSALRRFPMFAVTAGRGGEITAGRESPQTHPRHQPSTGRGPKAPTDQYFRDIFSPLSRGRLHQVSVEILLHFHNQPVCTY